MTLYHGTGYAFEIDSNRPLYLTPSLADAKEFALALNDLGEYNEESFIYALDIDETTVVEVVDFQEFDAIGYVSYDDMPEIAHNAECGWYCIKHPGSLRIVEHYKNEL